MIGATLSGELVTLKMSEPKDLRLGLEVPVGGEIRRPIMSIAACRMSSCPVARIDDIDVRSLGATPASSDVCAARRERQFQREARGPQQIAIRTYERGVEDETLACGTGVVASAILFAATENVTVRSKCWCSGGDTLQVDFTRSGDDFSRSRSPARPILSLTARSSFEWDADENSRHHS